MSDAIRAQDLNKSFGSFQAVRDVTFGVKEGGITALLGPSGSGKSTVLRMIAGLEDPTSGRIWIGDQEQTDRTVQERRIGMVFQHYALFRHMTVRENIAFGLSVRKASKSEQRKRADELLALVQLIPFADRYPQQLSGGQRQRVALARALAPRPRVLLLDEPFGALDARVRQDLRQWLDEVHRELGITSLLVTHDQEEALELAEQVIVMHEGRIEQAGTPHDIYNEPATPFVASFVGAVNVIKGLVIGGKIQFGDYYLPGADHLSDGSGAHAYVRPHDVFVSAQPLNGSTTAARIDRIAELGWIAKIHLALPDGQTLVAEMANEDARGLPQQGNVFVDLRNAKVFEPTGGPASDELAAG